MHQPALPDGIQEDRRRPEGLLLAIMHHVSERIEEVEKRHEERYKALDAKITNLTDSIVSYIDKEPAAILEKCEKMVDEAIPTHKDNPDATPAEKRKEHRRAHAKWIAHVEEELERWSYIRKEALKWLVGATLSGLVFWVLWSIAKYTER